MKDFIDISDKRLRFFLDMEPDDVNKIMSNEGIPFEDKRWLVLYNDLRRVCPIVSDLEGIASVSKEVLDSYDEYVLDWNDENLRQAYVCYQKVMAVYRTLVVCAKRAIDSPPPSPFDFMNN